jgi:hypothetical protein
MEHIRLTAGGVLQVQATRREHAKFKRLMLLRSSCKGRMLGDRSKPVQNHVISNKDDEASCIVLLFIIHTHGHVPDQPRISSILVATSSACLKHRIPIPPLSRSLRSSHPQFDVLTRFSPERARCFPAQKRLCRERACTRDARHGQPSGENRRTKRTVDEPKTSRSTGRRAASNPLRYFFENLYSNALKSTLASCSDLTGAGASAGSILCNDSLVIL